MAGSLAPLVPDEGLTDLLTAAATGLVLAPFSAGLFLGPAAAVRTMTAAGLLLAGYPGYLPQTFTWGAVAPGPTGPTLTGTAPLTFEATDDSSPGTQQVVGWFVLSAPGRLLEVFLFPTPRDMSFTGAVLVFTPYLPTGH